MNNKKYNKKIPSNRKSTLLFKMVKLLQMNLLSLQKLT